MKANTQETKNKFDYFRAGKFQIIIALLAYMQGGYWFSIGKASVVESGRASAQIIAALDWSLIILMVLAVVPLLLGISLIRTGRSLGQKRV